MEDEGRRRAFKFFITACVISAMYYYISESVLSSFEVDGGQREIAGVNARIIAVAQNESKANNAIKAGFDELLHINKLLGMDINKVNQEAAGKPVKVTQELFEVLLTGVDYRKLSKGAFDVTTGEANAAGGYEKLIIDSKTRTVKFAAAGLQLNLGGIAKGYAVDKAVEIMKRKGAKGGLVDAGGVLRCFGRPGNGSHWIVNILPQRPQRDKNINDVNEAGMMLKLKDVSVATQEGGVTIIAQRAADAEAIAAAVTAMGAEKGLELVDLLLGVEAVIVTQDGRIIESNGANSFLMQK